MYMKNKYIFLKRIYKEFVIVFKSKNHYQLYGNDILILKYFKIKNIINTLEYYNINYIILDNFDIIKKKVFDNNRYNELLYKYIVIELIRSSYEEI